MTRVAIGAVAGLIVLASAGVAGADWVQGDPFKMHNPQLPDPNGWDVGWCWTFLADDFQCTQSGPITDVHLWVSVQGDGTPVDITGIHLSIHSDVPAGSGTPSHPGAIQWQQDFTPGQWTMNLYGTGDEGWLAPWYAISLQHDHVNFYQINITDIADPFVQEQGTIYWLDVQGHVSAVSAAVGWKTSLNHWNDDAVWWDSDTQKWIGLEDPSSGQSLDMAFVITPEPATLSLLALGGMAALVRRKRK